VILSARAIKKPRCVYVCADCGKAIQGSHLYLYGAAEYGDKPYALRFCAECVKRMAFGVDEPERDERKLLTAIGELGGLLKEVEGD